MAANKQYCARVFFWALTILLGLSIPARATIPVVNGNINPNNIEIDASANLYQDNPNLSGVLNSTMPNLVDWVKDSLPNSSIILTPPATGYAQLGHWYGGRIVDGIGGADQDIFLKGGKEYDLTSWDNIGPGSVGSAKYDITQVYMANTQNTLYFGMERRGNNGTTAFVFEYNQLAPLKNANGLAITPNRSDGDVEFVFEMQGSGSSGSAAGYYTVFSNGAYGPEQPLPNGTGPDGLFTGASINLSPATAAPWGTVDSKGNWSTGPIDNYEFAEAAVPFGPGHVTLPGVNACGGQAYVQVRTRSSAVYTSDLKDTTPYFLYIFGGPQASPSITPICNPSFSYDGSGSKLSNGNLDTNGAMGYAWQFQVQDPSTGAWSDILGATATGQKGTWTAPGNGTYRGVLTVTEQTGCTSTLASSGATTNAAISTTPSLVPKCSQVVAFNAGTVTGGTGPYTYKWTFTQTGQNPITMSGATGTVAVPGTTAVSAAVTVSDSSVPQCTQTFNVGPVTPYSALVASITGKTADGNAMSAGLSSSVTLNGAAASGVTYQWQRWDGTQWQNISGANASALSYTTFETDATPTVKSFTIDNNSNYKGKLYTVQLRVHASVVLNAGTTNQDTCTADSPALTVTKVVAVDP